MIQASRTPFAEQSNGDLVCTITIPAAARAAVFAGQPVLLADLPHSQPKAETAADLIEHTVELETDEPPPTQTIEAGGFDTAQVVEAVTSGAYAWDHPAAPHMARIYKHEPFQRYAMKRLGADKFAAPMECATRLINKKVAGKPMDAAMAALSNVMNEYMAWANSEGLPVWPGN